MSLCLGYLWLGIAFAILASILLWNGFRLRSFKVNLAMIPLVIWYSMALFYVPSHLMGWPSNNKIPDKFLVMSSLVQKPEKDFKGGVYFWGLEWDGKKPVRNLIDPKGSFMYIPESMTPRAFRVDYSEGLQKSLDRGKEEMKKVPGGIIMVERIKKDTDKEKEDDLQTAGKGSELKLTILNPAQTLAK